MLSSNPITLRALFARIARLMRTSAASRQRRNYYRRFRSLSLRRA